MGKYSDGYDCRGVGTGFREYWVLCCLCLDFVGDGGLRRGLIWNCILKRFLIEEVYGGLENWRLIYYFVLYIEVGGYLDFKMFD